jgi:arylsulfatase A-like enzyme
MLRSLTALLLIAAPLAAADRKPNVLILYADDMGYADLACYGNKRVPTPHIDALAKAGVRFTDGYVSACVCSPSRVGLMTGRNQCRTGHDANSGRAGRELDAKEVTAAQRMKEAGYVTGIVGKWHLGSTTAAYLPVGRGFDTSFGSVSNLGEGDFYRGPNVTPKPPEAPITTPLYAREAVKFIEANRDRPFFLYVAFNAVHAPHVAAERYLERYKTLAPQQQRFAAMIAQLDDEVGGILTKLHDLKLEQDTLVFFVSDNGGAGRADKGWLRGGKWYLWEGGVRVPFIVRWTGRVPGGRVAKEPVVQLDVLPTALAAAGVGVKPEWKLDGVNLLPLLEGKADTLGREALYWRFGTQFAVRQGDWKLVKANKDMKPMLVNLAADRGEQKDLSADQPAKAKALLALWEKWNAENQPPRWVDRRWDGRDEVKKKGR